MNYRVQTQCIRNHHSTKNHDNMVWSGHPKRGTQQHTYIRQKTRRTKPVFEHDKSHTLPCTEYTKLT